MIKAIVFDYAGVIKINNENLREAICNYLKINEEDWKKEIFSINHLFNVKNKSYEEVTLLAVSKFDTSEKTKKDILEILKNNKEGYYLNNDLIDVIKSLKNKDFKIALLSNNSLELRQELMKDGITELFDQIIISAEVGYQKPQPEIFDILFKKLELDASEVIFIDDTVKSLEGADNIGYIPMLFKGTETFKSELSNILQVKI